MNDFTKQELEKLAWCVYQWDSKTGHSEPNYKELQNKVQSLIDTYCEHDNVRSISDADYVYKCSECGTIVGFT